MARRRFCRVCFLMALSLNDVLPRLLELSASLSAPSANLRCLSRHAAHGDVISPNHKLAASVGPHVVTFSLTPTYPELQYARRGLIGVGAKRYAI